MDRSGLAFISEPLEMLSHLYESKNRGTVVGISAPILGNGVFLTAVDDIKELDEDYSIQLKGYDITGYILERNRIRLSDIRAVCPFTSPFVNPYLKELTNDSFFE
jgi:hypothetical protein